ncbi:MAG: hypothetical protein IT195_12400 [Microthrixaceae bacterium]|nr:hypothetical protein [Microthrixaceae bacterium]
MTLEHVTYTCRCSACGHRWQDTLPVATVTPPRCPNCGSWLVGYRRGR